MNKHIIFLLLVFALGCNNNAETENTNQVKDTSTKTSNYLALGDSYTIGQSVTKEERFPMILTQDLNSLGYNFSTPRIIAKTGWTTDELDAAISQENIRDTFDLVTLLIGVNNQYRGRAVEEFRTQFVDLLDQAIQFAGSRIENVVVVSIPDWGVSPFAKGKDREKISEEINLFNKAKKEESQKKNIKFIDITDISRKALNNPIYIAGDSLHFSGEMHQLWVDEIINEVFK